MLHQVNSPRQEPGQQALRRPIVAPPHKGWANLATMQELYREAKKLPPRKRIDTYTFVPHAAEFRKGAWYVWRTKEEKEERGWVIEAENELRRANGLPPVRGPRPFRIPEALVRWAGCAIQVPLQFAANVNLTGRDWMRGMIRYEEAVA
jgi:hypothetical protein